MQPLHKKISIRKPKAKFYCLNLSVPHFRTLAVATADSTKGYELRVPFSVDHIPEEWRAWGSLDFLPASRHLPSPHATWRFPFTFRKALWQYFPISTKHILEYGTKYLPRSHNYMGFGHYDQTVHENLRIPTDESFFVYRQNAFWIMRWNFKLNCRE